MGIVHREQADDGLVTLTLDDGRMNALDTDVFEEIDEAFSSSSDAPGVVLAGREGVFTAGLNTKVLPDLDDKGLHQLLVTFGRTVMRIWTEPRPVVAACTGHAIAAGTMLAMACDHAVAARGEYRWGLTETQIGFPLPQFGIALARGNVRTDRLDDFLLPGAVVGPEDAVEAGFADQLAEPDQVLERATARARELMQLPSAAYAATKGRLRAAAAQEVLETIDADIDNLVATRAG
jgi:enoyl-CoA hydratase